MLDVEVVDLRIYVDEELHSVIIGKVECSISSTADDFWWKEYGVNNFS